jgi:conjugation system TraG family ATPase
MEKMFKDIYPIMGVEHNAILSKRGDITIAFEVELPEIFTLSSNDYELLHQSFVKAIKVLPKYTVLLKQDWFVNSKYKADFEKKDKSFLSKSSEKFFHNRNYLDHKCYVMLSKKPDGRNQVNSIFSSLIRNTIIPQETLGKDIFQNFQDSAGQFKRIIEDSGFIQLRRLQNEELESQQKKAGLLEKYCSLSDHAENPFIKDISFKDGIKIGDQYCQFYKLADVNDLPALCASRTNYDKYSTDRTKFSVGFTTSLGLLLPCNHIYISTFLLMMHNKR